jgi:hypothetical protein
MEGQSLMKSPDFYKIMSLTANPVILVEGRRNIPELEAAAAFEVARKLALDFPRAVFRSGNAQGSDQAFCQGVASVDPVRIQIMAPYRGHRQKERFSGAKYFYPEDIPENMQQQIIRKTLLASPKHKSIVGRDNLPPKVAVNASYLIRDTIKAVGCSRDFPRPDAALFYIDPSDPDAGGTGHTIRVCRLENVPVYFQDEWKGFLQN